MVEKVAGLRGQIKSTCRGCKAWEAGCVLGFRQADGVPQEKCPKPATKGEVQEWREIIEAEMNQ